jgi:hypothetical protein
MTVAAASTPRGRTYRLSPPDRTGLMFGLTLAQLLLIGGGVVIGSILMVSVSVPLGVAVLAVGASLGLVRVHGASVVELVPQAARYLGLRSRSNRGWFCVVPLIGGSEAPLPEALADQDVIVVDGGSLGVGPAGQRIAVSRDLKAGTCAATVRVAGRGFSLTDRGEQDWLVNQWGTALQAFIAERTPVVSIRWSEWAAPAGLDEHRRWLREHLDTNPLDDVRDAYERLLAESGSKATRHEVLVTVTINGGRAKVGQRHSGDRTAAAIELLLSEMRLFSQRLEGAGLLVSKPLSPSEWARAMRLRLDPSCRTRLDGRRRSLADASGEVSVANAAPAAAETTWGAWHTDDAWHRAMYVTEWPRLDVPAAWMSDLMLYNGAVRTVSVFFEPVPRSRSQRSITRDAAKLESDAEQRTQKGFRVGAHHRRAARAVEDREEELVAGYGEFLYAGVVCVTAATLEELESASDEVSQVAASVGLELRPLHGRHDQAFAATLPIARGLAPKGPR